jgi:hypothetical protein
MPICIQRCLFKIRPDAVEKPGAVVPHKRSNPCGTPVYFDELSTGLHGVDRVTGRSTAMALILQIDM